MSKHLVPASRRSALTARDVVAIIFRQRQVVAVSALAIALGAVTAIWLLPKQYEASMQLLVTRDRVDPVVTAEAVSPQGQVLMGVSEEDLRSEVELIKSPSLLSQVVTETGLYLPKRRFFGLLPPRSVAGLSQAKKNVLIAQSSAQLGKQLQIEPLRKTDLIFVSYNSSDPELSARVLQTLAAAYLDKHVAVHRRPESFKFFEKQTEEFHNQAVAAQKGLQDFNISGDVVDAKVEKQAFLQKNAEFQANLAATNAAIAETTDRIQALQLKQASTAPRRITQVRTSDNGLLEEQLGSTLLQLQLKYSDMKSKYSPEYEPLQELKKQVDQTQRALGEAKRNPVREETQDFDPTHDWIQGELAKANADLAGLKARAAATQHVIREYREATKRLDAQEVTQDARIRDAKVAEDNYLLYLRKMEEARISDALDAKKIVNVAIADPPTVPVLPAGHGWTWNLLVAGCMVFVGSVGSAYVSDRIDPSFRTPDEVRGYLETPVLATVPRNGK